jgi:hypothetical protein
MGKLAEDSCWIQQKCSKRPEEFWGVGGRVFGICGVQIIDNDAFTPLPALGNEA